MRAIKLYADGALGSRGAALLDPYSDDPGNIGLLVSPPEHIRAVSRRARCKHGFQVATHAIGDRGNRVTLDAYEAALKAVPVADHRFRIEHAQVAGLRRHPALRAARRDPVACRPSPDERHVLGGEAARRRRASSARTRGARCSTPASIIPNGSDFPVELVNPLDSFHAAITRQDASNWPPGGWLPWEAMTREEALKSMTIWPAVAGFQETMLGSLTPGKYADFVVLRPRHRARRARRDPERASRSDVGGRRAGVRAQVSTEAFPTRAQLKAARIVFALGILSIGWMTHMVHQGAGPRLEPLPDWVRYVAWVFTPCLLASMLVFRNLRLKTSDPVRRATLTFSGWAMGSGAALLGGLYYFYNDQAEWYFIGVACFVASLFLFPIEG